MSRNDERYKLIANIHGSMATATIVLGFVNPEIAALKSSGPRTIYDAYLSLMIGLLIFAMALGWLQEVDHE